MKLIKSIIISIGIFLSIAASAGTSESNFTLVNNYNLPLNFLVTQYGTNVPDLPSEFNLLPGAQISSRVVDIEKGLNAYIAGEDQGKGRLFFGVHSENNETKFNDYKRMGIYVSCAGDTITFCSKEFYIAHDKKCNTTGNICGRK